MKKPAYMNWSGGKDSAFALYRVGLENKYDIKYLLTTVSRRYRRISMHGVSETLLEQQAKALNKELIKVYLPDLTTCEEYEKVLEGVLRQLKSEGIETAIFGDIFLEDLRQYREEKLSGLGIKAHFPLWKNNTKALAEEFIDKGFKTILTCVDTKYLGKSFAGRCFDRSLLQDLPENVDPCGENGEFHTFVFEGPIFKNALSVKKGQIVYRKFKSKNTPKLSTGFYYCDLIAGTDWKVYTKS